MLAICISSEKFANKISVLPQKVICRHHKFKKGTLSDGLLFQAASCVSGLVLLLQMGTGSYRSHVTSASLAGAFTMCRRWHWALTLMLLNWSSCGGPLSEGGERGEEKGGQIFTSFFLAPSNITVWEAENTCVDSGGPEKPNLAQHARLPFGCLGPHIKVICRGRGRKFHQIFPRYKTSLTVVQCTGNR